MKEKEKVIKTKRIKNLDELFYLIKKQPMYFIDDFEDAVVRTEPVGDTIDMYIKYKGDGEFKTGIGNKIAHDAVYVYGEMITKEDYDNY